MIFPFHYRDAEGSGPCPHSGTEGWVEGKTCPAGCDGSRFHYSNDGHPECADNEVLEHYAPIILDGNHRAASRCTCGCFSADPACPIHATAPIEAAIPQVKQ